MKPIQIHPVSALGCVAVLGAFSIVQKGIGNPGPLNSAPPRALTPEQEEILNHVSIVYLDDGQGGLAKTIRFHDVNVQIVNGLGATNGYPPDPKTTNPNVTHTNGLGNLIVGYDEHADPLFRTGSHNIVVGPFHGHSSFGGLVTAFGNTISSPYAVVSGGQSNTASGDFSTVTGGRNNSASGDFSAVSGGRNNTASSRYSSVSGGASNTASGFQSSVTAGLGNSAFGTCSSVSGGHINTARGSFSSVSAGDFNIASGLASSVGGGSSGVASGSRSSVSGGSNNMASHSSSTVGGGCGNSTTARCDYIP